MNLPFFQTLKGPNAIPFLMKRIKSMIKPALELKFLAKKEALRASPFTLTSEIADKAQWGVDEIEERQRELATLAVDAWPL